MTVRQTIRQTILVSTIRATLRGDSGGGTVAIAPVFSGTIPAQSWTVNVAITPLDVSGYFGSPSPAPTYAVDSGSLPTGLSLDANTGIISGTPTAINSATFAISASNLAGSDVSNSVAWTVAAAPPAFLALVPDDDTYEMLGVHTGTGDLTTTHTATIYAPDADGVYRSFEANQPVWSEGRVVNNLAQPTDFSTYWSGTNITKTATEISDPDGGDGAVTLRCDLAGSGSFYRRIFVRSDITEDWICSVWIRRRSGTGTVLFYAPNNTSVVDVTTAISDGQWHRFSNYGNPRSNGNLYLQISMLVLNDEVDIYAPQCELVSGSSNTTIPAEFVPNLTVSASPSVFAKKTFANANGNTVTDNVVTEAVGAPLAEMPYLKYQPAATNGCWPSRNLTGTWTTSGTVSVSYNQVGITGEANGASLVSDDSAASAGYFTTINTGVAAGPVTIKAWIKKDNDETRFPGLVTVNTTARVAINTKTGAIHATGMDASEVIDRGDWWVVLAQLTEVDTAMDLRVYPAYRNTWGSSASEAAATGSCIIGNVEVHNKTIAQVRGLGPIFTTTAAVSTDIPVYSFSTENVGASDLTLAQRAAWFCEMETELQQNDATRGFEVYTGIRVFGIQWAASNSKVQTAYWTGAGTGFVAAAAGIPQKCGTVGYQPDGKVDINTDGVWHDENTDFSNYYRSHFLVRGEVGSDAAAYGLRNLRRYNIASYQEGKDIIDGLMT